MTNRCQCVPCDATPGTGSIIHPPCLKENQAIPDQTPPLSVIRAEPLTEQVAAMIRTAILSGVFSPGTRLSVPEIAKRFGVSRTPAREGLLMLEREGLVEPRSSSGMAVIMGDARDVLDLLDIREGLEAMSARRAAERMTAREITTIRALITAHEESLRAKDLTRHVEIDTEFHQMICAGTHNPRLARQLLQIVQQLRVLNSTLSRAVGWSAKAVIRDHRAILAGIAAHDPDQAEAAMRRHIERTRSFHTVTVQGERSATS